MSLGGGVLDTTLCDEVEPKDLTINIFQFDFVLFALNHFFQICCLRWLNKYISIFTCICMHMYEYALLCAYIYIYMYICILNIQKNHTLNWQISQL